MGRPSSMWTPRTTLRLQGTALSQPMKTEPHGNGAPPPAMQATRTPRWPKPLPKRSASAPPRSMRTATPPKPCRSRPPCTTACSSTSTDARGCGATACTTASAPKVETSPTTRSNVFTALLPSSGPRSSATAIRKATTRVTRSRCISVAERPRSQAIAATASMRFIPPSTMRST